jgi:hypothetical protein
MPTEVERKVRFFAPNSPLPIPVSAKAPLGTHTRSTFNRTKASTRLSVSRAVSYTLIKQFSSNPLLTLNIDVFSFSMTLGTSCNAERISQRLPSDPKGIEESRSASLGKHPFLPLPAVQSVAGFVQRSKGRTVGGNGCDYVFF